MSYKHFKLRLRESSTGYAVIMATCYVMKMTIICSTMAGHVFDTIIVASTDGIDSIDFNSVPHSGFTVAAEAVRKEE